MLGVWQGATLQTAYVPPYRTVQWATGYQTALASVTNDAGNVRDVAVTDHTTWVPSSTNSAVTVIWDMGAAVSVTRLRVSVGYVSAPTISFQGSNDGTTWSNAFSGSPPAFPAHFSFGWRDYDTTGVTTTQYRYWRFSISDSGSDARVADYRLYDGATQYDITDTAPSGTVWNVDALASLSLTTDSAQILRRFAQGVGAVSVVADANDSAVYAGQADASITLNIDGTQVRVQFVRADASLAITSEQTGGAGLKTATGTAEITIPVDATLTKLTTLTNVDSLGVSSALIAVGSPRHEYTRIRSATASPRIRLVFTGREHLIAALGADASIGVDVDATDAKLLSAQASASLALMAEALSSKYTGLVASPTIGIGADATDTLKTLLQADTLITLATTGRLKRQRVVRATPRISLTTSANNSATFKTQGEASMSLSVTGFDAVRRYFAANASIGNAVVNTNVARIAHAMGYADLAISVEADGGSILKTTGADAGIGIDVSAGNVRKRFAQADASIGLSVDSGVAPTLKTLSGSASITIGAQGTATLRVFTSASANIGLLAHAYIIAGYDATVVDEQTIYLNWIDDDVLDLDAIHDQILLLRAIEDL